MPRSYCILRVVIYYSVSGVCVYVCVMADPVVQVRDHPDFGHAAFAQRPYRKGDVVIREPPLIITGSESQQLTDASLRILAPHVGELQSTKRRLSSGTHVSDSLLCKNLESFLAWCLAPASVRQQVLDGMHATPGPRLSQANVVLAAEWTARLFAAHLLPRLPDLLPDGCAVSPEATESDTIRRVLLVWNLNSHAAEGRSALFEQGSKLAHTCAAPNTKYRSSKEEGGVQGNHVAMRDIDEGELLTTCYHALLNSLWSKPARQQHLHHTYGFDCRCERCMLPADDTRDLPCPRCVPREHSGMLPSDAILFDDVTTHAPVPVLSFTDDPNDPAPGPAWLCTRCGWRAPNDEDALFGAGCPLVAASAAAQALPAAGGTAATSVEARMWAVIQSLDAKMTATAIGDFKEVSSILAMVGRTLGCDHFCYIQMLLLHAEVLVTAQLQASCMKFRMDAARRAPMAQLVEHLRDMEFFLDEVEDDWVRVWSWLGRRTTLLQYDQGYPVHERLVFDAEGLVAAHSAVRDAVLGAGLPFHGGPHLKTALRTLDVATRLLDWVEPTLVERFKPWQTREPSLIYVKLGALRASIERLRAEVHVIPADAAPPGWRGPPLPPAVLRGLPPMEALEMMIGMMGGRGMAGSVPLGSPFPTRQRRPEQRMDMHSLLGALPSTSSQQQGPVPGAFGSGGGSGRKAGKSKKKGGKRKK